MKDRMVGIRWTTTVWAVELDGTNAATVVSGLGKVQRRGPVKADFSLMVCVPAAA
jgi:hypothetical protein